MTALDRLWAHVLADGALQVELARETDPGAFVALVVAAAARAGIAVSAAEVCEAQMLRWLPA